MSEISTTIRELVATARQIAESAQRVAHIAEDTASAARTGNLTVQTAQEVIASIKRQVDLIVTHMLELGQKSQQIGGILEIINELAEQTNILAINAAIEAVGAGEVGKRFAVVADEVRKLADRVGGSTKEIRTLIEEIRAAVTTTEAAREIELSTKQQTTAVEQVNIAIANVAQAAKESEASSTQTLQTASELTALSRELRAKLRTRGITSAIAAASIQQSIGRPRQPVCVAIGASTGGPAALREILGGLSASFPLPILLVMHIGYPFGTALAEWLDAQSPLRVACAVDGEPLPPRGQAKVIMAPPNRHLVLRDGRLWLTADPERHSCRPSVDVLFASVAHTLGGSAIACLLTGMGRDGAEGLLAVQRAGGLTLAQDEATSVVFGMPREAIRLGAARQVLPLSEIAPTLLALAGAPGV